MTTTGSPANGNLTKFSGASSITSGDLSGDVTTSGTLATTIANDAVTYAKMQNVSATSRVIGRKTAGSGDPEELTFSEVLDFVGSAAQGDILYRGASSWARLAAGTSGYVLTSQGAGANPQWAASSGGGGLVLLESHSASNSSSLDFTTRNATGQSGALFQSDYDHYIVEGIDIIASAGGGPSLLMRVGTGGGPTYDAGANYHWTRAYGNASGALDWTGSAGAAAASAMTLMVLVSNSSPTYFNDLIIKSPQNSSFGKFFRWDGFQSASDGGNYFNFIGIGKYNQTTALTALQFLMSSGNITSGTIRVYGVAKS